jgi:hypothetical protein
MVDTRVGKLLSRWTRTSYLKHSDFGQLLVCPLFLFELLPASIFLWVITGI